MLHKTWSTSEGKQGGGLASAVSLHSSSIDTKVSSSTERMARHTGEGMPGVGDVESLVVVGLPAVVSCMSSLFVFISFASTRSKILCRVPFHGKCTAHTDTLKF